MKAAELATKLPEKLLREFAWEATTAVGMDDDEILFETVAARTHVAKRLTEDYLRKVESVQ